MTELTIVDASNREAVIAEKTKDGKAKSLAGGYQLPEGNHLLTVADKKPFGLLEINSAISGKWILPIVAGVVTLEGTNEKVIFELSNMPGAKTLVIPNNFYLTLFANQQVEITVETRKGRRVVTNVIEPKIETNVIPDNQVQSTKGKRAMAF